MNEEIRTIDTPEMMAKCFSCTAPTCHNCLGGGKPKRTKGNRGEAIIGRPTEYNFDKLREMYNTFAKLRSEGLCNREIAKRLCMKEVTMNKRVAKFKKLCNEKGVDDIPVVVPRRFARPTVWTLEKLTEFFREVDDLRKTGLPQDEIAESFGIAPITLYERRKKYERMVEEGK